MIAMIANMRVKIGELKNNLSRYIHKVNDEGEVIIICDRDNPVACLSPLALTPTAEWRAYRELTEARAQSAGVELAVPEALVSMAAFRSVEPQVAADGRVDVETMHEERGSY